MAEWLSAFETAILGSNSEFVVGLGLGLGLGVEGKPENVERKREGGRFGGMVELVTEEGKGGRVLRKAMIESVSKTKVIIL